MTPSSDVEIGQVVEVNGERALVELNVDTTVELAKDYFPGQPGSHVKIEVRDRSVIGIVSSISMESHHLPAAGQDTVHSLGRRVADCILIGSMGANG